MRSMSLTSNRIAAGKVDYSIKFAYPLGRLIMGAEDVLKVSELAENADIVATHLDSVNHSLIMREDMKRLAEDRHIKNLSVPENGKSMEF